jgi:hypothetical protein
VVRVVNPKKAKSVSIAMPLQDQDEHLYTAGSKFRVVGIKKEGYYNDDVNTSHTVIKVEEVD